MIKPFFKIALSSRPMYTVYDFYKAFVSLLFPSLKNCLKIDAHFITRTFITRKLAGALLFLPYNPIILFFDKNITPIGNIQWFHK